MSLSIFNINQVVKKQREPSDWSNQELAEFYRISDIMRKSGLAVDMDKGLSDEGEPWAVFLKPDTGDVIAHFARIRGEFLSISSVDNKVYKGNDIRSVVNQMLRLHPLMVPNSNENGNLYLHPGVVLTPFVAAAFVLTTSESSAANLSSISLRDLDAVAGNDGNKRDQQTNTPQSASFRNNGPEDSVGSNHALLLGAVMLAYHSFSSSSKEIEATTTSWPELFLTDKNAQVSENLPQITEDQVIRANFTNAASKVESSKIFGLDQNNITNKDEKSEDRHDFNEDLQNAKLVSNESVSSDLQMTTVDGTDFSTLSLVAQRNGPLEFKGAKDNAISKIENNDDSSGFLDYENLTDVSEFFNLAQKVFFEVELNNSITSRPDTNGLGIAIEHGGEVIVVGLSEDKKEVQSSIQTVRTDTLGFDLHVENKFRSQESQTTDIGSNADPIIGHQLDDSQSDHLVLSDAIDVVFYSGGHKHVENFELGKDLLWFFLPSEKMAGVNSQVLNSYDMMLSFGDSGTLTLLDVINPIDQNYFS